MINSRYFYSLSIALLVLMISGCKKDELLSFVGNSKVYIYKGTRAAEQATKDSTTYSFATKLETVVYDTVRIPIRIMGPSASKDRIVDYEVMPVSTTDSESYELLPAVIKANEFKGVIPILVKKVSSLKEKEGRLWLQIVNSEDFETGVADQLTYLVKINDFLSKPPSWYDFYLGNYSQAKYSLIIRESGYTDFAGIGNSEFRFLVQLCKNWLQDYEAANGVPWLDENLQPVVFP